MTLRSSCELWKVGGGYYTEAADELRARPRLPDPRRLIDRRLGDLFAKYANPGSHVLEVGCGRSRWLPYLARERGCFVTGIDIEPCAAELARANLQGARTGGEIRCADAFSLARNRDLLGRFDLVFSMGVVEHFDDAAERLAILGRYSRLGGRLLTTVPNLQGLNWLMQWLGGRDRLEMHVVYDAVGLARVHEVAGLSSIEAGYVGFFDGYLSGSGVTAGKLRHAVHRRLARTLAIAGEVWVRAGRGIVTPEVPWIAPHVYCAAQRRL